MTREQMGKFLKFIFEPEIDKRIKDKVNFLIRENPDLSSFMPGFMSLPQGSPYTKSYQNERHDIESVRNEGALKALKDAVQAGIEIIFEMEEERA